MLPQVINERINPLLARIPQSIPFTQMVNLLTELLGRRVPAHVSYWILFIEMRPVKLSSGMFKV